jgi:Flp pilus assembly protein CpaB
MPLRVSKKISERRGGPKPLLVILLVGCCILSICAAAWSASTSQQKPLEKTPIVVGQFDSIELSVPIKVVPRGTKISEIPLTKIRFPVHQVPEGAIRNLEPYLEWVTSTELPGSLPLFAQNLSKSPTSHNPVITQIPPGMRAMAIKVDATSAVEGWATSGSHVDVILVRSDNETSTVVAEDVRVLSAERSVDPISGNGLPHIPSTVTLLVNQNQCLAINTAISLGTIRFALRNNFDNENWAESSYDSRQLSHSTTNQKKRITGYVTVKGDKTSKTFALSGGELVEIDTENQNTPSSLHRTIR